MKVPRYFVFYDDVMMTDRVEQHEDGPWCKTDEVAQLEYDLALANDAAAKGDQARAILAGVELERTSQPPTDDQCEIVTVEVKDGRIIDIVMTAPGLPDGLHNLYCEDPRNARPLPAPEPEERRCHCRAYEWKDGYGHIEDSRGRLHTERGCSPPQKLSGETVPSQPTADDRVIAELHDAACDVVDEYERRFGSGKPVALIGPIDPAIIRLRTAAGRMLTAAIQDFQPALETPGSHE